MRALEVLRLITCSNAGIIKPLELGLGFQPLQSYSHIAIAVKYIFDLTIVVCLTVMDRSDYLIAWPN